MAMIGDRESLRAVCRPTRAGRLGHRRAQRRSSNLLRTHRPQHVFGLNRPRVNRRAEESAYAEGEPRANLAVHTMKSGPHRREGFTGGGREWLRIEHAICFLDQRLPRCAPRPAGPVKLMWCPTCPQRRLPECKKSPRTEDGDYSESGWNHDVGESGGNSPSARISISSLSSMACPGKGVLVMNATGASVAAISVAKSRLLARIRREAEVLID